MHGDTKYPPGFPHSTTSILVPRKADTFAPCKSVANGFDTQPVFHLRGSGGGWHQWCILYRHPDGVIRRREFSQALRPDCRIH